MSFLSREHDLAEDLWTAAMGAVIEMRYGTSRRFSPELRLALARALRAARTLQRLADAEATRLRHRDLAAAFRARRAG